MTQPSDTPARLTPPRTTAPMTMGLWDRIKQALPDAVHSRA